MELFINPKYNSYQVSICPYQLSHCRSGALCRFEFSQLGFCENSFQKSHHIDVGYSDIHPWPELGDLSIADQVRLLKIGQLTSLTQRSLYFAMWDALARRVGHHLLKGLTLPKSHFLVSDLNQLKPDDLGKIAQQGYTRLKVKLGVHPLEEARIILSLQPTLNSLGLMMRLDFNEKLSRDEFEGFLKALGSSCNRIDFIEDPFRFDPIAWGQIQEKWKIRLALDRNSENYSSKWIPGSFSVLILKPAYQNPQWILEQVSQRLRDQVSIVITSYLDHPVGQSGAAWVAALMGKEYPDLCEDSGLLSHSVYKKNSFSNFINQPGPIFSPAPGSGVGWDLLLANLKWKNINEIQDFHMFFEMHRNSA